MVKFQTCYISQLLVLISGLNVCEITLQLENFFESVTIIFLVYALTNYIVACHLPRGSKLRWREDMGGGLPNARGPRIGLSLQLEQ